MTISIVDELNADHRDCLADASLVNRAGLAIPAMKARLHDLHVKAEHLFAEAGAAKSLSISERHWNRSGGRDAYALELALADNIALLERLVAGDSRAGGMRGWILREDVERILRFV